MRAASTKNIQFRVIIPANVKPGQMLRIRCPDGTEGDVRVPKGLKPGNSFIFEMPAEALLNKGLSQANNQSSSNSDKTGGGGGVGGGGLRKRGGGGGDGGDSRHLSGGSNGGSSHLSLSLSSSSSSPGFLDREIVDKEDFLTALAVGVLIGLSIVAGFLVGVIISTEP